jgi:RNA polymerase sigma-70 factor (ECF subfamily)
MELDLDIHWPAIGAGDSEAFGSWVADAERPLRAALRSYAARVDVEAVLQETLLRVWQVAERAKPDARPNGLLRLAHRIARNCALDELRRQRCEPTEAAALERLAEAAAERALPAAPDPHLRSAIARCREALARKPAAALRARLASSGAASDAELARGLGMKLNTYLQNIARARSQLADCLRRSGIDLALELR